MPSLARHRLLPTETGPALRALGEWTAPAAPGGGLHPGDVGWHLRFHDAAVLLWTDGGTPVAVGFLDGPVLRVTAAPGADLGALAADAEEMLVSGNDSSDGLAIPGWEPDQKESWLVLSWAPRPVSSRAEAVVGAAMTSDRVLVHRAAFAGSTFTVGRHRTMLRSPAGGLAVETLVCTPAGEPAAAATGWFAGEGQGIAQGTEACSRARGRGGTRTISRPAPPALRLPSDQTRRWRP
ncbi:GNAT family N-acetyltransferase [Streptomyces cyaneofuscatus]|uniref:GNAT family N-acetyltransferase n=1 Tax=Streptomyces cyaneofuscatus TaxID=66883 RepID=UPI0038708787|nr:GNAT family N-acetyltransferase [Streptomyces cyaneofuscatus]